MSGIGPLFSPHLIEEGVFATLQRWLDLYRDAVKNQYGVELPEIASWGLVDEDDDNWPEQALPALIVVAEKVRDPEKSQDGWYRAGWPFHVTVIVEHPERVWARKTAQIYGAVIRGVLLQRRSLGEAGRVTDWQGEDLPYKAERSRTEAASQNFFVVQQDEVVNWQLGPKGDVPPDEPPSDGPEVTEVDVKTEVE